MGSCISVCAVGSQRGCEDYLLRPMSVCMNRAWRTVSSEKSLGSSSTSRIYSLAVCPALRALPVNAPFLNVGASTTSWINLGLRERILALSEMGGSILSE